MKKEDIENGINTFRKLIQIAPDKKPLGRRDLGKSEGFYVARSTVS